MRRDLYTQLRHQLGLVRFSGAISFALVGAAVLSACGGSGAALTPAVTPVDARPLPPDPGAAATASLAGVDVNANGVRDEVERSISQTIADDAQYRATMIAAQAYQRLLSGVPPGDRAAALVAFGRISCAGGDPKIASSGVGSLLVRLTFDTTTRQAAYMQAADMTDGGYEASELPPCQ